MVNSEFWFLSDVFLNFWQQPSWKHPIRKTPGAFPEWEFLKFKLTNFTECTEENGSYFYLDDGKIKSTQNESLVLHTTLINN